MRKEKSEKRAQERKVSLNGKRIYARENMR